MSDFWKTRAEKYNELKWVKDPSYIDKIISSVNLTKRDVVLDLGCGKGAIANQIKDKVSFVVGLDLCPDMLESENLKCDLKWNTSACDTTLPAEMFDFIFARMVFHHLGDRIDDVLKNCLRMLKPKGKLIIAESIPPKDERKIVKWWSDIRALKEDRLTFKSYDLQTHMVLNGFNNVKEDYYILPKEKSSTRNWLDSSGLENYKKIMIWGKHITAPTEVKEAHKMEEVDGDILCEHKNIIVVGEKNG